MLTTIRTPFTDLRYPHAECHDFLIYIDESGQDRKPGRKGLSALILPQSGWPLLKSLIRRLVEKLAGNSRMRVKVKGREWPIQYAHEFADLIREKGWLVDCRYWDTKHPDWAKPSARMDQLLDYFSGGGSVVGVAPDDVVRLRQLFYHHRPYFDRYYEILRWACNLLADNQILARTFSIVADRNRIPVELHGALEWWAWVAASRRFPHLDDWVRERPHHSIAFSALDEEDCDGLIAADAIAYWFGMTLLEPKICTQQGIDQRLCVSFLDRMSRGWRPG